MASNMKFLSLRLKNFLRFGDKPTEIKLDSRGLVIIVGNNGQGKSTMLDGIAFALTGKAVRPTPPGKLVNNVNNKDMWASIDVEIDDKLVRITRGQKPGFLKFWVKPIDDQRPIESQEFSRTKNIDETQADIERLLRFNNQLFCCMVVNSTRRASFFQASSADRKDVTENLFGFTSMTDKAADLKSTRQKEEASLVTAKALFEERKTTRKKLTEQLIALEATIAKWDADRESEISRLEKSISHLAGVDFASEMAIALNKEKNVAETYAFKAKLAENERLRAAAHSRRKTAATSAILKIDAAKKDDDLTEESFSFSEEVLSLLEAARAKTAELSNEKKLLEQRLTSIRYERDAAKNSMVGIHDSCPTCKQKWPDVAERDAAKKKFADAVEAAQKKMDEISGSIASVDGAMADQLSIIAEAESIDVKFGTRAEIAAARAKKAVAKDRLAEAMAALKAADDDLASELSKIADPDPVVEVAGSAFGIAQDIAKLQRDYENGSVNVQRLRSMANPHVDTASRLKDSIPPEETADHIRAIESSIQHKAFLEKLLVRKDSPIRTAVLDRYLPYLNQRISHYLGRLELDYEITFGGDLDVSVIDGGNEIDPSAISGGEAERLSMAIAWSFRDVYEEITGTTISFSAIDERLDSGLDSAGAHAALHILVEMAAKRDGSLWLITHKHDFLDHADSVMTVERTSRFSGFTVAS